MDPKDRKAIGKALKRSQAPFVLRRTDIARSIHINKNDAIILAMLAKQQDIPETTMTHRIIGGYADCKLNDHAAKIKDLQRLVDLLRDILHKYIQKFGEIPLQSP